MPGQANPAQGNPNSMPQDMGLIQISVHWAPGRRTSGSYSRVRYVLVTAQSSTYRAWKQLSGRPGGSRLFSVAAMARVPYFASVLPHVRRMEPGFAEVDVPKWFFVHNHLHTVHAIASCNAAEIAMGMLMEATVPTSHRWIPKAMNVQYGVIWTIT